MSVYKSSAGDTKTRLDVEAGQNADSDAERDPDFRRANELMALHRDVKMRHIENGLDPDLTEARKDVERVMMALRGVS